MTADDLKALWTRMAMRLRAEIGDDLFNSWFGRMEADSINGGLLGVSVPTRFLKSWIENHYLKKLLVVAAAELPQVAQVSVKVRGQNPSANASSLVRPQSLMPRGAGRGEGEARGLQPLSSVLPDVAPELSAVGSEHQTFESFMVGPSNQLAHAAAMRVANSQPNQPVTFNPLYIHAAAGFGKTHLLNAIAQRLKTTQPLRRVMMLTAERFMVYFIQAVRQRDTLSFKDQFQNVDVLLIDDFQFLQGKAIQQEFCHAFNSLVDQRRQVVVAADVPPSQLDTVDQRMRSRLMGGLVVDIEAPDQNLRREIVTSRLALLAQRDAGFILPDAVLDLVAERIHGSARELEGALNRLLAYQQLNNQPVTLDLASVLLRDFALPGSDQGRVKIEDILKIVGLHYNVSKTDLLSPRRARTVVLPRQVGMYLAKKLTSRSLPEIGRRFGGRDHSTVLHAVRKIDEQLKADERLAKDVATLIRLVEQGPQQA